MSISSSSFPPRKTSTSLWKWFRTSSLVSSPEVLLMDGGVSTHLENMIAPKTFSHRDLWSSSLLLTEEGRAIIVQGHKDWLNSGSDILTTVTYQCHYGLFKDFTRNEVNAKQSMDATDAMPTSTRDDSFSSTKNCADTVSEVLPANKMRNMMKDGVFLARQAIERSPYSQRHLNNLQQSGASSFSSTTLGPFVVASTGPYGAAMADGSEYTGKYPVHVTRQALMNFHTRKARTLLMEGNPDGLAVETIPNLQEVGVVCEVLRDLQRQREESNPDLTPIACWISLACRNDHELNDGHTVEEALRVIQSYDPAGRWIAAIGINCFDSAYISSLVTTITKESLQSRRGIIIYPNSGEDWDATNEKWMDGSGTSDNELVDRLMTAVELIRDVCIAESSNSVVTVNPMLRSCWMPKIILGGCCRTNPATIARIRRRLDA